MNIQSICIEVCLCKKKDKCWKLRKKRNTIARLLWIPPTTGELFKGQH